MRWYNNRGERVNKTIGKNGNERPIRFSEAQSLNLVPSVTSVLDIIANPGLDMWKRTNDDWEEISSQARLFGDLIHKGIELYLRGSDPRRIDPDSQLAAFLDPVFEFLDYSKIRGEAERIIVGDKYAGTLDLYNKTTLIDFKTQRTTDGKFKSYKSWGAQLAGYRLLLGEKLKCENILISSTEPGVIKRVVYTSKEMNKYERKFKAALRLFYEWNNLKWKK